MHLLMYSYMHRVTQSVFRWRKLQQNSTYTTTTAEEMDRAVRSDRNN